jgi:hypothetical protein
MQVSQREIRRGTVCTAVVFCAVGCLRGAIIVRRTILRAQVARPRSAKVENQSNRALSRLGRGMGDRQRVTPGDPVLSHP